MKAVKLGLFGFSIAILVFLVVYANPARFVQIMQNANGLLIVAGVALSTLSMILRTARWHIILPQAKAKALLPIQLLGMTISNFTPGKVAEPAKTLILKLYSGIDVSHSFPSVVWERVMDVLALLILSAIALAMLPLEGTLLSLGLFGAAAFTVLAILALGVLYSRRFGTWLFRVARRFPFLSRLSEEFIETFYKTRIAKVRLLGSFAITLAAWTVDGIVVWLALTAVGITLDLAVAPGILALATIVGIASLLPGGIGGTDAIMAFILGLLGAESSLAITGSILARFLTFWYGQLMGGLALVHLSRSIEVGQAIKALIKS